MNASSPRSANDRAIPIALFLGFIITGIVSTVLGPILPVFMSRWSLDDAQGGLFFTTQFTGSMAGVGLSSLLLAKHGYRYTLAIGFFLTAVGIAGLNAAHPHAALVATAAYGCGYGLVTPSTNLCIAEMFSARRSAALSLLNMTWGVGAITCPIIILAGLRSNRLASVLLVTAAFALLLALIFALLKFEPPAQSSAAEKIVAGETPAHPIHIPVALGLLFFLYVGTETSLSGWAAEQTRRVVGGPGSTITPMFFFAGLLSGRALAAALLTRINENPMVIAGLLLAASGNIALLAATSRAQIILGAIFAGLGLASLYPIFIAWLSKWYGQRARKIGGAMFSLAAFGGATLPWFVGFVSKHALSLRIGLLVPLTACFLMTVLVLLLRRQIVA